jgi:SAM-dependent methyltransferase
MLETATCAACGARGLEPHLAVAGEAGADGLTPDTSRFGTALADIARCRHCGHMQLEPMPPAPALAADYAAAESTSFIAEAAGQRETARRALERIERHASPPGSLLDLGCWLGFLLAEARSRGWRTTGVEPSAFASAYAREQLGLDVITGELMDAPRAPHSFDVITMGDVIEHLPDPGHALRKAHELLVPGGVLWLALPDAGSRVARAMGRRWWSVLPTHVHYFTRGSLATLLGRHGFEVRELTTSPKAFSVRYYLGRVGGYSPPIARVLVNVAAGARLGHRIWAPDCRDRMAVIAAPAADSRASGAHSPR